MPRRGRATETRRKDVSTPLLRHAPVTMSKRAAEPSSENLGKASKPSPSSVAAPIGEKIAILDAGAQYGKVIDRRVRELSVECDLLTLDTPASELAEYAAIIVSGGPQSVNAADAPKYDPAIFSMGKPLLGICYGLQLLNHALGGTVVSAKDGQREDGAFQIELDAECALFDGIGAKTEVLLTHGDSVDKLPGGFKVIATSGALTAGIADASRKLYGVQFHPEVDLSVDGTKMLRNFLYGVCGLSGSYSAACRQDIAIDYIRNTVGPTKKVLCLVSGGVDSSVCAALLNRAIGPERLICLHIDHGFMRHEESSTVVNALQALGVKIDALDASATFLAATTDIKGKKTKPLGETVQPEEKRKIIGDTFMVVTQKMCEERGLKADDVFLAQGTLRPDLIESASALVSTNAECIKTHHNDTQLVRQLRDEGRILEPLRDYHKDEVRELGLALGLPSHLVWRQPFPGPGLAIRILCADEPYVTDSFDATLAELAAVCKAQTSSRSSRCSCLSAPSECRATADPTPTSPPSPSPVASRARSSGPSCYGWPNRSLAACTTSTASSTSSESRPTSRRARSRPHVSPRRRAISCARRTRW